MVEFDFTSIANITLLLLLLITTVAIVMARNLLTVIVLQSFFSFLMAAEYLVLAAPDVAITEAAVGVGISTALLLCTLILVGERETRYRFGEWLSFTVIAVTGAALLFAATDMPAFGDPQAPIHQHVGPYYLSSSAQEIGIPNVVTSILASYRGFDTLGEVVVILTAALSVWLMLYCNKTSREK